jgi:hypothetical protein
MTMILRIFLPCDTVLTSIFRENSADFHALLSKYMECTLTLDIIFNRGTR